MTKRHHFTLSLNLTTGGAHTCHNPATSSKNYSSRLYSFEFQPINLDSNILRHQEVMIRHPNLFLKLSPGVYHLRDLNRTLPRMQHKHDLWSKRVASLTTTSRSSHQAFVPVKGASPITRPLSEAPSPLKNGSQAKSKYVVAFCTH